MAPNILAVGGSAGQMIPEGYQFTSTTNASYIAPYAKQGVGAYSAAITSEKARTVFSDVSVVGVSAYYYTSPSNVGTELICFCNGNPSVSGNKLLLLRFNSNKLVLCTVSGTTETVVATGTTTISSYTLIRLDINVTISDTEGVFNVYLNRGSSPEVSFSGDTKTQSHSTVNNIKIGVSGSIAGQTAYWSAIIVADGDTRKLVYKEHTMTGAGGLAEMSGAYTTIDETGIDDTDFITANTSGQRNTFTKSAIDAALTGSGYNMVAQVVWMRATTDPTSMTKGRLLLYDGTNLSESSDNTLAIGYMPYQKVFSTPPDGGSWNFTKAGNTQPGIKALA